MLPLTSTGLHDKRGDLEPDVLPVDLRLLRDDMLRRSVSMFDIVWANIPGLNGILPSSPSALSHSVC